MTTVGLGVGQRILTGLGPEFAAVLDMVRDAVTICDREDRFVYANRAALERLGLSAPEQLAGRALEEVAERYLIFDEHGGPIAWERIASARALEATPAPEPTLVRTVHRETGATRWEVVRTRTLQDPDGTVAAVVSVTEDVTELRRAEVHTQVLAESGRMLAASLDYEQTLRNVAEAAVPALADWCLVELVSEGVRQQTVVAHVDPQLRQLASRMQELEPSRPRSATTLARVLATGESEMQLDVSDAHLQGVAVSDEQLALLRALEIRSAIVAPMRVAARITGAMSFFTSVSARRFTEADRAIAEQLARRAAVVVDNARLHTTLAGIAGTLQESLLPAPLPDVPGWEIGALWRPAFEQPRVEIGGDFYDVFDTAGTAFATIGDVTGHGVRAATTTSLLRHGARFASHVEPDPVAIIRRLDEELRRSDHGAMATALCAALHDHSLLICSAGHPPALIADRHGRVSEAPASGPLLGGFPDSTWHQERIAVA